MKILYYDCFAGISGDMNLAAMIDLGVEPDYLRAELSKLGLNHEFELMISADSRHGIHGTRVDVVLTGREASHSQACEDSAHDNAHPPADITDDDAHIHADFPDGHAHHHEHGHSHEHSHTLGDSQHGPHPGPEGTSQGHAHSHGHGPHRNLEDIEFIIKGSTLAGEVKKTSLAILRKVAEAEAKVHAKALHEVHFHEVGATDSIVDIVGAAICFHRLGVDAVWSSPVELGGGFVCCAHGLIPVPAPATVEILTGIPTTRGVVKQETATPTGAAILAALVDEFTETPALVTEKTAYGIGHRESDIPNVLRVHLASPAVSQPAGAAKSAGPGGTVQKARLLQCNIDDMTAEMLGVTMDLLMENGAMDAHFTPILMKKNRPATCISLLCGESDEERFKDLLFRHTTTLGIKSFLLDKTVLETSFERMDTPLGAVTMKNALIDGKVVRSKPELEDCRELAKRHGLPLAEVYALIAKLKK